MLIKINFYEKFRFDQNISKKMNTLKLRKIVCEIYTTIQIYFINCIKVSNIDQITTLSKEFFIKKAN